MRFLGALLFLAVAGCATAPSCSSGLRAANRIDLYFGLDVPGRGPVTAEEWRRFADGVLTLKFPAGFTVFDAAGQWRNPKTTEITRENAKVVSVIGADLEAARSAAAAYRTQFHQESVGITQADVCAAF